nr:hypothetical protein [Tanacetum cinerariifolium]
MKDEHLDTILEIESDKFIKSSVKNLVPNPSESEDGCERSEGNLFEPSFNEEIISIKMDPHHFNAESDLIESLLNHDSSILSSSSSSKIDSLLDEFAGELILLKSIPPGIDETDCDPEEEIRLIEKLLPKETGIKFFLGGEIGTMMAPGGSFMTSFEDIISFLSMHTPSNDLIGTYS